VAARSGRYRRVARSRPRTVTVPFKAGSSGFSGPVTVGGGTVLFTDDQLRAGSISNTASTASQRCALGTPTNSIASIACQARSTIQRSGASRRGPCRFTLASPLPPRQPRALQRRRAATCALRTARHALALAALLRAPLRLLAQLYSPPSPRLISAAGIRDSDPLNRSFPNPG
jgi:hypothetical protein